MFVRESVMVGGRALTLETGRLAKQAHGAVLVTYGDTMVLVTAVSQDERPGLDFFPLTCEFVEKTYAAGKIPGGFFKREARQRDEEILACRIMDRPLRPLFPEGFKRDTQIIATVLSSDKQNKADVLALTGASAALHISDIPWHGPVVGVRVGRLDGEFVAYPTVADIERCDIQHQSFGGGKHLCLGASLARAEAQEALAVLLERFAHLRPAPRGFAYRATPSFRGLAEYWVQV